jgi:exodeoxyribonuclease III
MLKVITWNCNMAFRKKSKFIEHYKPDILIVPECEHPDKLKFDSESICPNEIFWYGTNLNKGLGVFSYTNFKISLLEFHEERYKMILPLKVTNDNSTYTIFAIWANNPHDKNYQYIGQVWKAINFYQNQINNINTLLIGDFNSNTIWDKHYRDYNHSNVVKILAEKGIESLYHQYFEQQHGKEILPTLFLYRHQNKPYHIDYCFASTDMIEKLKKVQVGEYEDWIKLSDHMPLIIDFD